MTLNGIGGASLQARLNGAATPLQLTREQRNAAMLAAFKAGENVAVIAARHGLKLAYARVVLKTAQQEQDLERARKHAAAATFICPLCGNGTSPRAIASKRVSRGGYQQLNECSCSAARRFDRFMPYDEVAA